MKVLICGDRNWGSVETIEKEVMELPKGTIVVHGAARGADSLGGYVARKYGLEVKDYPADWTKYGIAAGVLRNQLMLDIHPDIDLVLAFHGDIENSKGTADMVRRAEKRGLKVKIITGEEENNE